MNIRIDSHIKPPKRNVMARRAANKVKEAYGAYSDAYFKVYAVRPTGYTEHNGYIVIGSSAGVTLARLREMTTQLKYRIG